MAKNANTNPMAPRSAGIDYGAVRLARKKANISNNTRGGTNTASPGVSLNRPNAKFQNPMGKGQPAKPAAAKLNRRPRTK